MPLGKAKPTKGEEAKKLKMLEHVKKSLSKDNYA